MIYRRRQGMDLTSHYRIERRERPPFFVELEYRSAMVPIFGTDVDASALRTAAKLVGEGAAVEAVEVDPGNGHRPPMNGAELKDSAVRGRNAHHAAQTPTASHR